MPVSYASHNFIDIELTEFTQETIVDYIIGCVDSGNKTVLLPMNADCYNLSCNNIRYKQLLVNSGFPIYADGAGITKALSFLCNIHLERIATTDLIIYLLQYISKSKRKCTIGFVGGQGGIVETAKENLNERFGINNILLATEPPMFSFDDLNLPFAPPVQELISYLKNNPVDILFLGFGSPKQDFLAEVLLNEVPCKVFIPCGGLFAYYAEQHKRAPAWMQNAGFEWFFRFMLEPRRLWKRYLIGNVKFISRILREKWRLIGNG